MTAVPTNLCVMVHGQMREELYHTIVNLQYKLLLHSMPFHPSVVVTTSECPPPLGFHLTTGPCSDMAVSGCFVSTQMHEYFASLRQRHESFVVWALYFGGLGFKSQSGDWLSSCPAGKLQDSIRIWEVNAYHLMLCSLSFQQLSQITVGCGGICECVIPN